MGEMTDRSVNTAIEHFLRLSVADGDARPRTIGAYRAGAAAFTRWAASVGINPLRADHEDVLAYRAHLVAAGYSRATIQARLVAVRLLYKALQRWGGRLDNPAEGVRAPKRREGASSAIMARAVTPQQARATLEVAPEGRDGAIVRLMLSHGLRAGECAALVPGDLSPAGDVLNVPGKGGKRRILVLSYRCREDLSAAMAAGGPTLFQRRGGGSLSVRSIERAVNKVLDAAGARVPGRSAHSLRHGHALLAAIGGAGREALADEMGHADIRTTDIYTRAAAAYQANPTDAVERALRGEIDAKNKMAPL